MVTKSDEKNDEKAVRLVPVRTLKGYQPLDTNQKKILKGEGVMLPLDEAKAGIAAKVLERADPLPGDYE